MTAFAARKRANLRKIGTCPWFGKRHSREPFTTDQPRHVGQLLFVGTETKQSIHCSKCQSGHHLEPMIGAGEYLRHRSTDRGRHCLSAIFLRCAKALPTTFGDLTIGFFEPFRQFHPPINQMATLTIARLVQRGDHTFSEVREMGDDLAGEIGIPADKLVSTRSAKG